METEMQRVDEESDTRLESRVSFWVKKWVTARLRKRTGVKDGAG